MRKIKIFLTMLAVAGVLFATSSCVDDSESTSVTDLRGAKATQLKAQAELALAQGRAAEAQGRAAELQAAAEEIKANAEKALKEAEAQRIVAQTDYEKEKYKSELAKLQSDVELALAKNKASLDSLAIAVLIQEAQLNLALKLLKNSVNDSIQKKLKVLTEAYSTLQGQLNAAANSLAVAEVTLTKAKLNLSLYLADTARLIDKYIAGLNNNIASNEKSIANLERQIAQLEEFEKYPDADSIIAVREKELAATVDTIEDLYKAKVAAQVEADTANAVYERANERLNVYNSAASGPNWALNYAIYGWVYGTVPVPTTISDGYKSYNYKSSGDYIEGNDGKKYYFVGYSFDREKNLYTWADDWGYYIGVVLLYNVNPGGYTSKEDYEARSNLAELEKGVTDAEKVIADSEKALPALYKSIDSIGKKVDETEAAFEKAKKDYESYIAGLSGSPTVAEMTFANALKKAYNGDLEYPAVPNSVRDSTGGALGVKERTAAAYALANYNVLQLRDKITGALSTILNNTEMIKEHELYLELLSLGPKEKLDAEVRVATEVKEEKDAILTAANTEYNAYVQLTGLLRAEISNLINAVYGLFDNENGYLDDDYYYTTTEYVKKTEEWLKSTKENYANSILQYQTINAGYELKKDRAIAALYGGDNTNYVTVEGIVKTLIPDIINYYNDQIVKAEGDKKVAEEQIAVYTKQIALLKAAIDALLAE